MKSYSFPVTGYAKRFWHSIMVRFILVIALIILISSQIIPSDHFGYVLGAAGTGIGGFILQAYDSARTYITELTFSSNALTIIYEENGRGIISKEISYENLNFKIINNLFYTGIQIVGKNTVLTQSKMGPWTLERMEEIVSVNLSIQKNTR